MSTPSTPSPVQTAETAETPAPYGDTPAAPVQRKRVRIPHLHAKKERGERWAMLTAYDVQTAQIFDEAGIPVLLVGDSAGNTVFGYDTTVPVTLDEMVVLTRAVATGASSALVVADLPFGTYQASPEQAYLSAARLMKEGLAHAVKLEGGAEMAPTIERLTKGGIPVMAHIGFTPQSEHTLGGYRVQGRGDAAAGLLADARAVQAAGAFAVVLEMVTSDSAAAVTEQLDIPTIGIGAGADCDAQVLVWQDMAGLGAGRTPRFVKRYADVRSVLSDAARAYAADVAGGSFPAAEHSFER
ncbi:3-methyl-2-oxobutanoate hydroxymethyltransferase [Janibacter sp. DB-40]|uniref:3-methyl-2-oxobutanoate hydroxymethyltransferase n=1 Tax=Janibacter sp. DB-40 TaxID=3028808 RepID=UPI002407040B|nr:3-methyl-2-oxobutanoate hydroxymethyltransferase [Janibacter sp. DB-40]